MLSKNNYSQNYINACRAKVEQQIIAYDNLIGMISKNPALEAFEPVFFNNMVLALENYFMHRAVEQKDWNALNEVRLLSNSLLLNDGVLTCDDTLSYKPEKAVLGYPPGAAIKLKKKEFLVLADAFFSQLETKFAA